MYEKNYEKLADAIVSHRKEMRTLRRSVFCVSKSAECKVAKDYRRAKSAVVRNEIKSFFLSDWFSYLTDTDGRKLFKKLEQER